MSLTSRTSASSTPRFARLRALWRGAAVAVLALAAVAPAAAQDTSAPMATAPTQAPASTPAPAPASSPPPTSLPDQAPTTPQPDSAPLPTPAAPATPATSPADASVPAAAAAAPMSAPPLASAPVQGQPLAQLDIFSTGREAGLGQDLWKGSSADIARAIIPTLAEKPLSPAGIELARRLLAQAATAPDGAGSDADLAAARARALLALSEVPLAQTILDHTPGLADNPALSQTAAEAALITGQEAKACAIGDALTSGRDGVYWLRLRTYCQLIGGKAEAAQLTFTLATQQGKDAVFSRLMSVALNGAGDPGPASLRDGLDYALSKHLSLDLTPALASAPPAIADQLAAGKIAPAPAAAAAPASLSEPDVLAPLKAARTEAAFTAAAKAQAPALAALVQAKSPMTEPLLEARAALIAGDLPTAQAIRDGLNRDDVLGPPSLDAAIFDAALAAADGHPDDPILSRLVEAGNSGDAKARERTQAAAALLAALSGGLSDANRARFMAFDLGRDEAPTARLLGLESAAAAGRKGEAGLLALSVAQSGGAGGPNLADRVRIVRDLNHVGLKTAAQAFAVEGLLALLPR